MHDTDAVLASKNGREITGRFYKNALEAEGTPTHATVKYIAGQFDTNTSVVQYACQRNSMFIVTDGFSNTTSIATPPWDAGKSANTWGAASPTNHSGGSLSDLALRYYTNRLRAGASLAGQGADQRIERSPTPTRTPTCTSTPTPSRWACAARSGRTRSIPSSSPPTGRCRWPTTLR